MKSKFDLQLEAIEPNLFMLPWIGEKYESKRLLFIGESDYDDGVMFHKNWKREWIDQERIMGMGRDSRLLENIDKTILDDLSAENRKNLWNSVAYTNLVQRPMDKEQSTTTRPNFEDIIKGWEVTLQTILILKPKFVIKWGFLGDNNLRESTINKHFNEWEYEEINGNRFLLLKHSSQFTTKIFFIQHPSSRYSWSKWKEKINLNLPELKEII